ncbi:GntR family transcriptional regulator [Rhizomonospora bruguierae]|uniref:GntR family transcriptional regulator n=1 Tax=Rhizomonospora bruguierae TaxID=1581705 RepID=UPI001BCC7276|nr:winged helix-turn-helix domain-containing protein [Micromonospora sp. NBRC 107566]
MISPGPDITGYQQLADHLRDLVRGGQVPPGRRLPSETALMQTYGLARETVRRAVRVLRNEGLAEYIRGYGVVVREQPPAQVVEVGEGAVVTARMPTTDERVAFQIAEGVPVLHVAYSDGSGDIWPADAVQIRLAQD